MKKMFVALLLALMTVSTSAAAQERREVTIPVALKNGTREVKALIYTPAHGKPAPAVLVLHAGSPDGLHEYADEDYARALAKEGFVAVVPDYGAFDGQQYWGPPMRSTVALVAAKVKDMPEVGGKPVGTVGFSLGVMGMMASTITPAIKAVVVYYGGYDGYAAKHLPRPPTPLVMVPLDDASAEKIAAPVLLLHGEKDDEIPASQAKEMHEKLKRMGKTSELVIYPDAYHRFDRGPRGNMDGKYVYQLDGSARDDAFRRTIAFLHTHLGR
ncbi:MAG: hypothetical protein RL477_1037 [Pseudomonadota bacterium]|jgi:carboxymethylenebutenolidase